MIYDKCAYRQELAETTGPGIYHLATPPNTCQPCHPSDPYLRLQKTGVSITRNTPLADVDSELTGRSRNSSKCPERQFIPSLQKWGPSSQGFACNPNKKEGFGNATNGACRGPNVGTAAGACNPNVSKVCVDNSDMFVPGECNGWNPTENTRLSNPSCNLRGAGAINRWEYLPFNPQDRVEIPYDFNINSVMIAKDTHRVPIDRPFNQKAAWPKPHNEPMCHTITSVPYNPTLPASTHWQAREVVRNY